MCCLGPSPETLLTFKDGQACYDDMLVVLSHAMTKSGEYGQKYQATLAESVQLTKKERKDKGGSHACSSKMPGHATDVLSEQEKRKEGHVLFDQPDADAFGPVLQRTSLKLSFTQDDLGLEDIGDDDDDL